MATASTVMSIVADRTGIPFGHVRVIARRLIEDGVWPAAYGSLVPELTPHHVVLLLLALGSGCAAKDAPTVAQTFFDLPYTEDPAITAGHYLTSLFLGFNDFTAGCPEINTVKTAEISGNVSTVTITTTTDVYAFADPDAPASVPAVHSTTFDGSVFVKIAYDLVRPDRRGGTINGKLAADWKADAEEQLERMVAHLDKA